MTMTDLQDLTELFRVVSGCCLHNPEWSPEQVDEIVAWEGDHESFSESSSLVIARLVKKGRQLLPAYGLFIQSEDYTGHGCQCDSLATKHKTLKDLLGGLDDYQILALFKGVKGQDD